MVYFLYCFLALIIHRYRNIYNFSIGRDFIGSFSWIMDPKAYCDFYPPVISSEGGIKTTLSRFSIQYIHKKDWQ